MTFEKIRSMIADMMDIPVDSITMESSFEDMKVDSLDMVEIVMDLEDAFGITIEKSEGLKTVADLVKYIDEAK